MLETILDYWIVWVCGLVATGATFLGKRYFAMRKKEQEQGRAAFKEEMSKTLTEKLLQERHQSEEEESKLRNDLESVSIEMLNLKKGVLAMQGKEFKAECRALLQENHIITLEEYEQIVDDHEAYHALGGNHKGDSLFNSVEEKWKAQLNK